MPLDFEMLLSSSSHTFFTYPPCDSRSYYDGTYGRSLSYPRYRCAPRSHVRLQDPFYRKAEHDCFINSASHTSTDGKVSTQELFGVRKKKVSFADDKGLKLVEVREIPSPPKWADDVLTLLIGGAQRSVVKEKKWRIAFEHPPWSDDNLVEALETNMVALERLSVQESKDDYLVGTIKVKNLAFEKNVFLRVSFDRWLSYIDIPCTFLKSSESDTKTNKYDTFSFNFKILPIANRYEVIEFSICFQCGGKEYWDNNGGINYRLIAEYSKSTVPDLHKKNSSAEFCSEFSGFLSHTVKNMDDRTKMLGSW